MPGVVGRNPHSPRIWMHLSVSRKPSLPDLQTITRRGGSPSENRSSSVRILRSIVFIDAPFTEEQIIGVLKPHEAGRKVPELAREMGVSEATIYTWKSKYGGMEVNEAQRLKGLEDENRRLKHLVADLSLDKEVLKAVIRKNGWSLPA